MRPDQKPRDAIVDDVRRLREEHAARFGYELDAIVRDLKRLEAGGRKVVVLEPKRAERVRGVA